MAILGGRLKEQFHFLQMEFISVNQLITFDHERNLQTFIVAGKPELTLQHAYNWFSSGIDT